MESNQSNQSIESIKSIKSIELNKSPPFCKVFKFLPFYSTLQVVLQYEYQTRTQQKLAHCFLFCLIRGPVIGGKIAPFLAHAHSEVVGTLKRFRVSFDLSQIFAHVLFLNFDVVRHTTPPWHGGSWINLGVFPKLKQIKTHTGATPTLGQIIFMADLLRN